MPAPTCPPDDQLSSLLSGQLDPTSAEALEQHVETCDRCQETVRSFSIGDESLLQPLKEVSAAVELEPGCERAMARIRAFAGDGTGDETGETVGYLQAELPKQSLGPELKAIREYQLLEKLGEGGMGAVYKAVHARLDKTVALKLLPRDRTRDQAAVARFQREMKAVGKLEHPHIVRAMDAGEVDGMHFLVMEYVQGMDLGLIARRLKKLPIADACELIRQAALGLAEAHEHGMVHRDIKPSNLILAKPRRKKEQATVKVLDLGLALLAGESAFADDGLTSTGQMMGTVDYMAPEQCRSSHDVDIRADIYSLGATLYRLLSGSSPLGSDRDNSILSKLVALATKPAPPLTELRPDVPPALAKLVHTMLAKEPAERFATPEEVADALSPFCSGADLGALLKQAEAAPESAEAAQGKETLANRKSHLSDTATSVQKPTPHVGGRSRFFSWALPLVAGVGGLALLWLGIVLFWKTPHGTVRVEINDDNIQAKFDKNGLVVTNADTKPITITAGNGGKNEKAVPDGEHTLTITRGDFRFQTKSFQLDKNGEMVLKIELLAGDVKVSLNDKELDRRSIQDDLASPHDYALDFDGTSSAVELPSIEIPEQGPMTIEAWVTPHTNHRMGIVWHTMSGIQAALNTWHQGNQKNVWSVRIGNTYCLSANDTVQLNRRVHVAGVWQNGKCDLYVGGERQTRVGTGSNFRTEGDIRGLRIGAIVYGEGAPTKVFDGLIDEFRVSAVARYEKDFTPQERFSRDADTLALYHCDEGTGGELKDSSGNGHDGKVIGAKWVRLDGSAGQPVPSTSPPAPARAEPPGPTSLASGISALEFNGKSDYVELPAFSYDATGPLTVEAWFTAHPGDKGNPPAAEAKTDAVIGAFHPDTKAAFFLIVDRPKAGWFSLQQDGRFMNTCFYWFERVDKRTDMYGTRHHAALVFDGEGEEVRLYVDGEPKRSGGGRVDGDAVPDGPANVIPMLKNYFLGAAVSARDGKSLTRFFHGVIDEVRISQSERYKDKFVPDQRLSSDAATLALYQFEEGAGDILKDASGKGHDGKIVGAKWVKLRPAVVDDPQAKDYTLDFNGKTSHVHVPKLTWDGKQPITLEAWVKVRDAKSPRDFVGVNGALKIGAYRKLRALAYNGPNEYGWLDDADATAAWRHVAATFDGERLRWFIDGRLAAGKKYLFDGQSSWDQAELPVLTPTAAFPDIPAGLWIGGERRGKELTNPLDGQLDEIRISRGVRYAAEFKPERRLAVDAETLALYHCNEGGGDTLWDSSSNKLDGQVVDVKWQEIAPAAPSLMIAEPPPLEEWLKGRKVRTVAQDGSGEFKTIAEALRAVRPHEVVEVLDRGPYQESLPVGGMPLDTGLISRQQTVIELPSWDTPEGKDVGWALALGPVEGFRLSGFRFHAPPRTKWGGFINLEQPSGLVVEDCCFGPTFRAISFMNSAPDASPNLVRSCLFDHATVEIAERDTPCVTFEQNYFKNAGLANTAKQFRTVVIRRNVFDGPDPPIWLRGIEEVSGALEISNNTALSAGIDFVDTAPPRGVVCRNNLTERGLSVSVKAGPESTAEMKKNWQLGFNGYVRPAWGKTSSDVLAEPEFLSTNPADSNYLRLAADAPQATGGAGEGLPSYIGALPPGPAPRDGDWFTRLRERWGDKIE